MTLFEAVNASARTTNGAKAFASTLDPNVDFFFQAGASRGKDIVPSFVSALVSNPDVALRTALWMRDAREGAGERELFSQVLRTLAEMDHPSLERIIPVVPEIGRWDDLLVLLGTKHEVQVGELINSALASGNALCAKWMPRKGAEANKLRKLTAFKTPKLWRKTLVALSNTVEQKMCAKEWDTIEFGKVPSVAAARYQQAFNRNAPLKYAEYKQHLVKGEAKINAGAVYPYDVIKCIEHGDYEVACAQWAALPNYMEGSQERILPVVDVSGSMTVPAGGRGSVSCLDVAVSLGLYISERNEGIFKDQFVTFSTTPEMVKTSGSLQERLMQMQRAAWCVSTDIEAVFELLLSAAKTHGVAQDQMPTKILILSDMQFNFCAHGGNDLSLYESARLKYEEAGYKLPQLVFWNINHGGNAPVTCNQAGVALVSGFSPSILKSVLQADLDPVSIMLKTVMKDRYTL